MDTPEVAAARKFIYADNDVLTTSCGGTDPNRVDPDGLFLVFTIHGNPSISTYMGPFANEQDRATVLERFHTAMSTMKGATKMAVLTLTEDLTQGTGSKWIPVDEAFLSNDNVFTAVSYALRQSEAIWLTGDYDEFVNDPEGADQFVVACRNQAITDRDEAQHKMSAAQINTAAVDAAAATAKAAQTGTPANLPWAGVIATVRNTDTTT